jgi:RPA family protein
MSDSGADGPGRREVAHRLFAAEFEDADLSYSESDEERAPNYVVTPSGARVNRLFAVGVLTEVEQVSEDVLRGRVVDPTGAFVLYAGQYQPDEQAFLDRAEPPMFVAVTGKARTFQPDDADTVYTSVRPETISEVDADTRDRWTVDAAERTLDRVGTFAAAARMDARGDALADALRERGVDESLAEGVALALDHYGTTGSYLTALRELALDAARVVAGQREEVEPLTVEPGAGEDGGLGDLAANLDGVGASTEPTEAAATETGAGGEAAEPSSGDATDSAEATVSTESTGSATPAGTAEPAESTEAGESPGTTESATATTEAGGADESSEAAEQPGTTATVEPTAGSDTATEDAGGVTGTEAVAGAEESDDIGDFEGGGLERGDEDDLDDFEPEEFELDEEEREEIEEEYGTDFQSGTEVEEPGEAGIETPDAESEAGAETAGGSDTEPAAGADAEPGPESEPEGETVPETGSGAGADDETAPEATSGAEPADEADSADAADGETLEGADLEDAVVDLMGDLDEGDGVAREDLVGAATDRYGVDAAAVEDAIQDALMGGRCYEPDDGTLKPI